MVSGRFVAVEEGVGESVEGAGESEKPAVVDQAVDDRGGEVVLAEDGAPSREVEVGGDDQPLVLICLGDGLEQQPASVGVDGQVAQLVENQQAGGSSARTPISPDFPTRHPNRSAADTQGERNHVTLPNRKP